MIGDEIRKERLRARMSQERLAEIAGIHRTYVSLIERNINNPTMRTLMRISRALGIDTSALLERVEEWTTEE